MNVLRKDLRLILTGLGVMAWVLSFPFYGPLAFQLLVEKAVAGTHSFALGHAAGFFFLGGIAGGRPDNRVRLFTAGAAGLSAIALVGFSLPVTGLLFGAAGFLAAWPVITWTGLLTRIQQPAPVFAAVACAVNLWCWLAGLPFGSLFWNYLWLGVATSGFLAAALFLRPKNGSFPASPPPRPMDWPAFRPLLLFAVAAYTVGGLLYRIILPLGNSYRGVAWAGFLPYVLAMVVACRLFSRNSRLLCSSTLVLLGLAVLPLVLSNPLPGPFPYLFSYVGVQTTLAFADLIFWMGIVNLARAGSFNTLGFGIGTNVLILFIVGALVDFARLAEFFQLPLVAFGEAAILFILLPLISPRLGSHPFGCPPDPAGELSFSRNDGSQKEPALSDEGQQEPPFPENLSGLELPPLSKTNVFTPTEKRILLLLLEDRKNTEIAALCYISLNTVKFHVRNILRKTGCRTRKELIEKYRKIIING